MDLIDLITFKRERREEVKRSITLFIRVGKLDEIMCRAVRQTKIS